MVKSVGPINLTRAVDLVFVGNQKSLKFQFLFNRRLAHPKRQAFLRCPFNSSNRSAVGKHEGIPAEQVFALCSREMRSFNLFCSIEISLVRQSEWRLSRAAHARVIFSRMSLAFLVQMLGQ